MIREFGYTDVHVQRANTLIRLGRLDAALATILELQRFAPLNPAALLLLAHLDRQAREWEVAAVRYIQVLLLDNGNEFAWRGLEETYRQLGPAPLPVRLVAGRRSFDDSAPMMRRQLNTALRDFVSLLHAAKLPALADHWIDRAIRLYACPPEVFADLRRR